MTTTPTHNSTFNLGSIKITALHTPCHTQDSICFFFEDGTQRAVFTGDTLFIGGCGRFFEGNATEMHKALNEVLAALPDDTKVYPGHEYTKGNVRFAKKVLSNEAIAKLDKFSQENKETQGKFTIGDEKVCVLALFNSLPTLFTFRNDGWEKKWDTDAFFASNTTSSCASTTRASTTWSVRPSPWPS